MKEDRHGNQNTTPLHYENGFLNMAFSRVFVEVMRGDKLSYLESSGQEMSSQSYSQMVIAF